MTATDTGTWTVMDHVIPGTPLADADPATVTLDELTAPLRAIAAAPAPADDLPHLADWLHQRLIDDNLTDLPPGETAAPLPERKRALDVLDELATDTRPSLCHGDPSPWNVLRGSDGRWLLIDPRGLHGEVEYDAAVMAIKISAAVPSVPDMAVVVADAAELDCDRVRAWTTIARAARV
ncbi:aminoglycoside phosphotransferase family protein [Amycolatopsis sp. NPDC059027]|uniref:aminoglycoside phosphotransferase family protein n=1 Tax=Amycolatopsis sp. NPDC059027 TaxID=3346709 RepID=UPI00366DAB8F